MTAQLTDKYGRNIEYLRLSVTDRCDLRCNYCMPEGFKDFGEPEDWLTFDEIERIIRVFGELGTRRIRITGGEPLVRKNLPELAARLSLLPGIEDLSLSSNATRMQKQAEPLKKAGISRINISLDTLRADRFKQITGGGKLEKVINGLLAAKEAGFHPVKINMVVMRGVNDDEVEDMVQFCIDHDFTLRFIETMPMGNTGREASLQYIPLSEIHDRLAKKYNLVKANMNGGGPARYVRVEGTELRIGYITPMSQHFCDTCNRVRLSVDGTLYLCLGQDDSYPLRELMRAGITDDELKQHIQNAIDIKPEKHEFSDNPQKLVRFMSMTGG
ncbi:MAG: GTP 3',8-cyclase MoaA [Gammaproteobacteria bacterium]|nr:GTP 3',8-cyclase MoaA [Gammaproteobacteria bacterium]MCW8987943.1 GTP 3',8-cyclase MoaA [Gammaproteobacteria bacterium]